VRFQRLPGTTSNVLLGKLEGNNPAGSVKDRPALSMIAHAEARRREALKKIRPLTQCY
jgi:cysteine synthase B